MSAILLVSVESSRSVGVQPYCSAEVGDCVAAAELQCQCSLVVRARQRPPPIHALQRGHHILIIFGLVSDARLLLPRQLQRSSSSTTACSPHVGTGSTAPPALRRPRASQVGSVAMMLQCCHAFELRNGGRSRKQTVMACRGSNKKSYVFDGAKGTTTISNGIEGIFSLHIGRTCEYDTQCLQKCWHQSH